MLRQLWKLHREFVSGIFRVIKHGVSENRKGLLISLSIIGVFVAVLLVAVLEITATPEFCGSCHNMNTYIESWRNSTHKDVACTECHFEPGLKGMLVGKWKAQAHIVMKITGTAPSRPHTQISDDSCLREGCHSVTTLAETPVVFKGVHFDHESHLGELRRGKDLRCVSCHSQIVQGEHLTVTESTCFACHFYGGEREEPLAECQLCHQETKAKIYIDANENMPFVHKDYLDRNVPCEQCHFDVIFGDGHLNDNICVQCHSEPDILISEVNAEKMHKLHVSEHKVECYRCHSVIDHGIIRPESTDMGLEDGAGVALMNNALPGKGLHYDTNCVKCHSFDQHESIRLMYMGAGAAEIPDYPSPMYQAHADCGSCHIAITPSADGDKPILRLSFDKAIQSCADCHGEGYDVMAKHWKDILTDEIKVTQKELSDARKRIGSGASSASEILDIADKNLAFVRNGHGVHNMDYALKILEDTRERAQRAIMVVDSTYKLKPVDTPNGCTQLCHSCVECIQTKPVPFGNSQFPHDVHVEEEGFVCLDCHSERSDHGKTFLRNCNECHHGSGVGSVECSDCHIENHNLYNGQNACDEESCDERGEKNVMVDAVACDECHVEVADDKRSTVDGIKGTCLECHDEDESYAKMVDEWIAEAATLNTQEVEEMLASTQRMVLRMIKSGEYTYDAQDLLNKAEKNLKLVVNGNPVHNYAFSKDLLNKSKDLVEKAKKDLQTYSTIKTLDEDEYIR